MLLNLQKYNIQRNFLYFLLLTSISFSFGNNKTDLLLTPPGNEQAKLGVTFVQQSLASADVDVAIIESQSYNAGHNMDLQWSRIADGMGLSNAVYGQFILDSLDQLVPETAVIIASGIIDLSDVQRSNIIEFLRRGGNIYLQNEYQFSFSPNQAFEAIVDSLDGKFEYDATWPNQRIPMVISGVLSSNYNIVDTLNYFWYGCAGSGDETIKPFLTQDTLHFGFLFTPPNPEYGHLITNSDQDWVRTAANDDLMENILAYMKNLTTAIEEDKILIAEDFILNQNYPNPFNPQTTINYNLPTQTKVTLKIFDVTGREVSVLVNQFQNAGSYSVTFKAQNFPSGVYFYALKTSSGYNQSRKMILIK